MSYKLTQTGQEVQALLNQIKNGGQSQVTNAVLYTEQALDGKEKEQARQTGFFYGRIHEKVRLRYLSHSNSW